MPFDQRGFLDIIISIPKYTFRLYKKHQAHSKFCALSD